jgi:Tol biopolymer transport system component
MSDDVKDFLQQMANEMPELRAPGRRPLQHARRAAAVTLVCSLLIVSGLGIAAFAGIRSLSAPPERTVQPPRPVTAQNGRIAFARTGRPPITDPGQTAPSTRPHIFTMLPDGTDVRQLTTGRFIDQWPSWSPDGTRLVFSRARSTRLPDHPMPYSLYSVAANGTGLTRLTQCPASCDGDDVTPVWSPDGSRIAFISTRGGSVGLWTIGARSGDPHLLRGGFSYLGGATWSPDGTRIALGAGTAVHPKILLIDSRNGAMEGELGLAGLGLTRSVSWSPDGATLVIGADVSPSGKRSGIYLLDVSRADVVQPVPVPRLLLDCRPDCRSGDSAPVWSADGKQIVFVRGPGAYSAGQVWVVSADGTGQQQLTDGSLLDSSPAWQPVPAGATIAPLPSPSFAEGEPCPTASDPDVPSGAGCLTVATGDFDGDGVTDRFLAFASGVDADGSPLLWPLEWVSGDGGDPVRVDVLKRPLALGFVRILGTADVNGDARPDVLVLLRSGASTEFVAVYLFVGSDWHRALNPDGTWLEIHAGGTVLFGEGGGCPGSGLQRRLLLSGAWSHGPDYRWRERWFRWNGARLVSDHVSTGRFSAGAAASPPSRFWEFSCDGLILP